MEVWRCPDYLFPVAESRGGIIYSGGYEKKKNLRKRFGCKDEGVAGISHMGELHYKAPTNKLLLSICIIFEHRHIGQPKLPLCLCVVFYSSFVYTCVCVFLHIPSPLRECRSIRSGISGLPYYCAPLVCVSAVMELLAVW